MIEIVVVCKDCEIILNLWNIFLKMIVNYELKFIERNEYSCNDSFMC